MAKNKKVTYTNIANAMEIGDDGCHSVVCGMKDNAVEVLVKKRLSLTERRDMVQDIVDMLFMTNADGVMCYYPYLKKFAFEYNIITYFTNVSLPSNLGKAWDFIEQTGLAMKVATTVREGYVQEIIGEANETIEMKKAELLKATKFDGVLDGIADVVKSIKEKTDALDGKQIMEFVQNNAPELKDELAKILKTQATETAVG